MVSNFMKAAAEDLDINLRIVTANRDHLLMTQLARDAAVSHDPPDYIILVNEKRAAGKLLRELPQNINIILLNNGLSQEEKVRYGRPRERYPNWLASVVPDHKQAGRDIMKALSVEEARSSFRRLKEGPIGLIAIGGNRVTMASAQRLEGMQSFIASNSSIELYQTIHSEWRRDKAEAQMFGLLGRWPSTRMIWAANDPMALGALVAAKRRQYTPGRDIYVGGLNWSNEALQKVDNGQMAVTVGGHFMLGGWTLVLIYDRHNGRDFEDMGAVITIPMGIITRDNVTSYLNTFGDENWREINFRKFSRSGQTLKKKYDFSLTRLLAESDMCGRSAGCK